VSPVVALLGLVSCARRNCPGVRGRRRSSGHQGDQSLGELARAPVAGAGTRRDVEARGDAEVGGELVVRQLDTDPAETETRVRGRTVAEQAAIAQQLGERGAGLRGVGDHRRGIRPAREDVWRDEQHEAPPDVRRLDRGRRAGVHGNNARPRRIARNRDMHAP
jgi:hypothetical protein